MSTSKVASTEEGEEGMEGETGNPDHFDTSIESLEECSAELDWSFSLAIDSMELGPQYAENLLVMGQPAGDSLVDTVWSYANPLEWIRALRNSGKESE
ncbi:hypothetical protein N7486_001095 [Penicillium sp. IBT 16267x]|nr:hypothetical protein N7486_001095 [Penicillium sp. IBT 16267x]